MIRIVSCVGLLLYLLRPDALVAQTKPVSPPPRAPTTKSDSPPSQATQQTREIDELQKKVKSLSSDLQSLDTFVYQTLLDRLGNLEHESASFDPSSPGPYQRIDTVVGPMLVALGKAEQYLDGYTVELQIGNLTAADLVGFKIDAKWAKRYRKEDGTYWDWFQKRKAKGFSMTNTLASGKWNVVKLILPDTKPTDFGHLQVSITLNTVSMGTVNAAQ